MENFPYSNLNWKQILDLHMLDVVYFADNLGAEIYNFKTIILRAFQQIFFSFSLKV